MGWANVGWPIVLTQILSLAIAGTAISSTYLAQSYSIDVPTLQSVLSYALLAFVYIPYYAIKGPLSLPDVIKETWWKYAALGFVEAEANYCIVKAYQYTSVTSVQEKVWRLSPRKDIKWLGGLLDSRSITFGEF